MPKETAKQKKDRLAEEAAEAAAPEDGAVEFEDGEGVIVDFGNIEEQTFEVLPRGNYAITCVECAFEYSQSKGTPMWSLRWEVTEGEHEGHTLYNHMVMAGAGLPMVKRQLGRIRPDLLENPFNPEDEEILESMIGVNAIAKVAVKKFEGTPRNNIRDLFPPSDEGDFG